MQRTRETNKGWIDSDHMGQCINTLIKSKTFLNGFWRWEEMVGEGSRGCLNNVWISQHFTTVIYSKGMRVCNIDYSFTKGKHIWAFALTPVTAKDKPSWWENVF